MHSIVCLLFTATLVYGVPTPQQQTLEIAKSAKSLQSIAHMAVVDTLSPLHVALSSLDSAYSQLQAIAAQKQVNIPQITVPTIDLSSIFSCHAKSAPKYSAALNYIVQKEQEIKVHQHNATLLAHGLQYVSQMIINKEVIKQETLQAVSSKLSKFLSSYSSLVSEVKSVVCIDTDVQHVQGKPQDVLDTPLSIFYDKKGCSWMPGGVCRG